MLVAYRSPDKGYRYPIRRGSGLFITFRAFGDASIEVFSRIVPRFSFYKPNIPVALKVTSSATKTQIMICTMSNDAAVASAFFGGIYILQLILYLLWIVLFGVVLSLIFRPYILWYFKINKRLKLQEETNRLLNDIASNKTSSSRIKLEHEHSAYLPK